MRQVVHASAAEHRGHLGDGKHLEPQAAEVFDDPCHGSGFTGARATCQHNLGDFIGDLISHFLVLVFLFYKRMPKLLTISHSHNLFSLKDVKVKNGTVLLM
jgi:hypothetical protein